MGPHILARTGICPVCKTTRRLFGNEGLVYRHGRHDIPCPGSGRLPSTTSILGSDVSTGDSTVNVPDKEVVPPGFDHPQLPGALLKHVPKAARSACCVKLCSILRDICTEADNVEHWALSFDLRGKHLG